MPYVGIVRAKDAPPSKGRCRTCNQIARLSGGVLVQHDRPVGIVERKRAAREERGDDGIYRVVEWGPWEDMPSLRQTDSDNLRAGGRHYFSSDMLASGGEYLAGLMEYRRARIVREPCPGSGSAQFYARPAKPTGEIVPVSRRPTRDPRVAPAGPPEPPKPPAVVAAPAAPPPPPRPPEAAVAAPAPGRPRPLTVRKPAPRGAQARRRAVLGVAAGVEDEVHAIFRRQAEVLGTDAATLIRRLGRVNVDLLMGEMDWEGSWQAPMRATLARVVRQELVRAGSAEAERLGMRAAFNADNPFAIQYTREHVPNLVRETQLETQMAIGDVVRRGFLEQRTPKWMAQEIRQVVGLTTRQAESVLRIRRVLERQGATQAAIDKAAARQHARLIRHRATLIARTETIRVNAAGTQAAWMQARGEGTLPAEARRKWIEGPGERTCPLCRSLGESEPVGIMEPFRSTIAGSVFLPPVHPACRCTVSLVLSS